MPVTSTLKFCSLASAIGRIIASTEDTRSFRVNSLTVSTTFPLSILDTSSISLIRLSRCWPDAVIFFVYSLTLTGFSASLASKAVKPRTAFIGVRISCDIFDKNIVLELLAICAACNASASLLLCISLSFSRSFLTLSCCFWLKEYKVQHNINATSITITTIKIFWFTVLPSCCIASTGT